jgi:hypothetical protein
MGMLWRLLAPKPLKKARRSVRKAAHPIRTASWALSPKNLWAFGPRAVMKLGSNGPASSRVAQGRS